VDSLVVDEARLHQGERRLSETHLAALRKFRAELWQIYCHDPELVWHPGWTPPLKAHDVVIAVSTITISVAIKVFLR